MAIAPPLCLSGRVVPGFKRGSKELGVPTANLEMTVQNEQKVASLVPGVYCGIAVFRSSESNADDMNRLREKRGIAAGEELRFRTALSIGWNPSYDNARRTIEAFLLEEFA